MLQKFESIEKFKLLWTIKNLEFKYLNFKFEID